MKDTSGVERSLLNIIGFSYSRCHCFCSVRPSPEIWMMCLTGSAWGCFPATESDIWDGSGVMVDKVFSLSAAFVPHVFLEDQWTLARIKIWHCYMAVSTGIMRLGRDKEILRKKRCWEQTKINAYPVFSCIYVLFSLLITHILLPSRAFNLPSCHYTLPINTLTRAVSLHKWKFVWAENSGVIWCHCKKSMLYSFYI